MKELKVVSDEVLFSKFETMKNPTLLAKRYVLSENFIDQVVMKNSKNENKNHYGMGGNLSWWWEISSYQPLTDRFISKYKDKIIWHRVFAIQNLSEDFILKYINVDRNMWYYLSHNLNIGENFIRKYQNKLNWYEISKYQPLSESFILEFANKVHWTHISSYQKLSENFILENQELIKWGSLFRNRNLAKDFYERNKHLIKKLYSTDLARLVQHQTLEEETLQSLKKGKMVWASISLHGDVSRDFVIENYDKINKRNFTRWNKKADKELKQEVEMIEKLSGDL